MPILTIIIAVYNCERYIRQAIMSVLLQPCDNYELIVMDDGSDDHTGEIVQSIIPTCQRIKYHRLEHNVGVSVARNRGIDFATGKYITFLDADDLWVKDFYDEALSSQLEEGIHKIYYFGGLSATEDLSWGRVIRLSPEIVYKTSDRFDKYRRGDLPRYIFHKSLLIEGIRFMPGMFLGEDIVFLYQITHAADHICVSGKLMYVVRVRRNSVSRSNRIRENYEKHNAMRVAEELMRIAENESGKMTKDLRKRAADFALSDIRLRIGFREEKKNVQEALNQSGILHLFEVVDQESNEDYMDQVKRIINHPFRYRLRILVSHIRYRHNRLRFHPLIRGWGYRIRGGVPIRPYLHLGEDVS